MWAGEGGGGGHSTAWVNPDSRQVVASQYPEAKVSREEAPPPGKGELEKGRALEAGTWVVGCTALTTGQTSWDARLGLRGWQGTG